MNTSTWKPSATITTLQQRAQLMTGIRTFFKARGYLEVETPVLARYGVTDVYLSNMTATFRGEPYYLQTSPEYHMKRLLAAGSGPIFQLARVFRDDELGRWHNPEFTLLEWYQLDIDHHGLMDEMEVFLQQVLGCKKMLRRTYQQVFLDSCGIDPLQVELGELKEVLQNFDLENVLPKNEVDRDQYLFLLMSHVVEPHLAQIEYPVAVYNFPKSQAALARIQNEVAQRFEVYFRGVELANGFHELTDAAAQRERFEKDLEIRCARGLQAQVVDEYLLQALQHGLPPCSGVALGVERLLALALDKPAISEIMCFDFSRA